MQYTRQELAQAEAELQASWFNAAALRVEPRAGAEGYARLKPEVTAAEVRLQTLRVTLTESVPEVPRAGDVARSTPYPTQAV